MLSVDPTLFVPRNLSASLSCVFWAFTIFLAVNFTVINLQSGARSRGGTILESIPKKFNWFMLCLMLSSGAVIYTVSAEVSPTASGLSAHSTGLREASGLLDWNQRLEDMMIHSSNLTKRGATRWQDLEEFELEGVRFIKADMEVDCSSGECIQPLFIATSIPNTVKRAAIDPAIEGDAAQLAQVDPQPDHWLCLDDKNIAYRATISSAVSAICTTFQVSINYLAGYQLVYHGYVSSDGWWSAVKLFLANGMEWRS